ncbi:MAG: phage shock protein A [Desulfobacula sp.]|jgi:phage shock protein A|uniref:PspA/IM30 family protein n=1 Tax=Desulfobacula sp. TaxID=2593537 RepID=UPI001DBA140F|nr:phage shock protein A [Desulfobacula sp.]MBT3485795.1 phage shock protein A [Desulfobacula sp.]MBT3803419.1 phage shock protein A [Desulfobacula sp.]MBT4024340.1 phage shock protein A [Desulfobacula sp.]MBT4199651.1 phage shock protein A [Desulfobacula sp.]
MGIFTRFKDIVASNMSSMLDKAEDPEKLIKLMIREMEDTLIEIKSSCANAIANQKKVQRLLDDIQEKENFWANKAELAVEKGKDALARQALQEKRRYTQRTEAVAIELTELEMIIEQYRDDICELENKLKSAREKQRLLVQRHIRANGKKRAQEEIRRAGSTEIMLKFEELENHIERMEAEADLVNFGRPSTLEEEFDALEADDDIEAELNKLKSSQSSKKNDTKDS